jgi:hypothetical protein
VLAPGVAQPGARAVRGHCVQGGFEATAREAESRRRQVELSVGSHGDQPTSGE